MNSPQEQFSRIYDQYIEKIYRFVYLKVSSQEVAEDLTSKVFLSGWESYQKDQNIKNPGALLYKIARNKVIDYYRSKDKTSVVPEESLAELADKKPSFYDNIVLSSDMKVVKDAIADLKKDYQDVIIWHYLEDMSADEIAQIMERPAGTVRVMIHRALAMLKEGLEGKS